MERQSSKRDSINKEIINLTIALNEALFCQDDKEILKLSAEIEVREFQLNADEFQPFWNEEKNKFDTYANFVQDMQNEFEQNLFDIKELTGEGNYKEVEQWTWLEVIDYSKRKAAQIQKRNAKRHKD